MGANLSIVKPEAGTNMVLNPSLEVNATGYTAVGGTAARGSGGSAFGCYGLTITPTAGTADGAYYGTVSLVSGTTYTFSVYVKGVNGVPYRIYFASTAPAVLGTPTTFTGTGKWQRVVATYTETSTTTRRLYLVKNNSADTGVFYADGWQCEAQAYVTTYIDGEQDGCRWSGQPHLSASTRDAQSREGGRPIALIDTTSYLSGISSLVGIGVPALKNIGIPLALLGGLQYQRTIRDARTIMLLGDIAATDWTTLHTRRQNLIDLVKPDLVYPQQPFWLRYYNDVDSLNKPVRIRALYESGLDWAAVKGTTQGVPLRFLCYDPLWYDEIDSSAVASFSNTVTNANYIIKRDTTGAWSALGTGANGTVYAVAFDKYGRLYAGGSFTSMGGVANTSRIAMWDGSAWNALGTGAADQDVYRLAFGPDGTTLYAAGRFSAMGGVANTAYIARWDGAAWNAMGTGGAGGTLGGRGLALDNAGNVYVAGDFTSMGGVANTVNIAKWNGSAWSALGTGGLTGATAEAYALTCDAQNNVYVGGNFDAAGGVTCAALAKWNGSAWVNIGNVVGTSRSIRALTFDADGTLYAGGLFTSIGGVTAANIARWNGTAWSPVSSGADSWVLRIARVPSGGLLVSGEFTVIGGLTLATDRVAFWNGSAFSPMEVDLPGSPSVYAAEFAKDSTIQPSLVLGFTTSGSATAGAVTALTAVVNTATAETAPRFLITGPGTLVSILNATNGRQILFNGLTLNAGEEAVLDLSPQSFSFNSSFRGSLMNTIVNPAQMATWRLSPGANSVSILMTGTTGNTLVRMVWRGAHWAADGVST